MDNVPGRMVNLAENRPALILALAAGIGGFLALFVWGRWVFLGGLSLGLLMAVLSRYNLFNFHNVGLRPTLAACLNNRWFILVALALIFGFIRFALFFSPAEVFLARWQDKYFQGEGRVESYLSEYQAGAIEKVQAVVAVPVIPGFGTARIAVKGEKQLLPLGATIQFSGYLNRPETAANPGGFDARDWLWRQGILLETDIAEHRLDILKKGPAVRWRNWLDAVLGELVRSCQRLVGAARAPLLLSLLIGETSGLTAEQDYYFRQAGLSHLMAVSGANIAFWLTPLTGILRRLRVSRLVRQLILLVVLVGFGFLTGWQVSVGRAIVMMSLFLIARLFHQRADPLNSIGWVGLVFLVVSPLALLSFGFWLSLLATVGMLVGAPWLADLARRRWPKWPNFLVDLVSLNLAVQMLVLPLTAVLSQQLSLVGFLANLPAVWLVEWLTGYALVLLSAVPFWTLLQNSLNGLGLGGLGAVDWLPVLGRPLAQGLDLLQLIARSFARIGWGRLAASRINNLMIISFVLIVLWYLYRERPARGLLRQVSLALLIFGLAWNGLWAMIRPRDEVWFLSVGQGDATLLIDHRGETTLIDAGKPETGWKIILPTLDALGIWVIDRLILTHGHLDHAGGASDLIKSGRVREWLQIDGDGTKGGQDDLTKMLADLATEEGILLQALPVHATIPMGSKTRWMTVLSRADDPVPGAPAQAASAADANEKALHFRLQLDDFSVLLMSDCTAETEADLLATQRIQPAHLLHVAHHGSKLTTRPAFLDAVNPLAAVISVGPNQYGHPTPEVLERLAERDIRYLRTDRQGAIQATWQNEQMILTPYRKENYG